MGINERLQSISDGVAATRTDVCWIKKTLKEDRDRIKKVEAQASDTAKAVGIITGTVKVCGWLIGIGSALSALIWGVTKGISKLMEVL